MELARRPGLMVNNMPAVRQQGWVARGDAAGFPEIWVEGGLVHITAAAIAARQAQVGSGILTAWVHEPAVVAAAAAQVQGLAGGRFRLGIGGSLNPAQPFLMHPRPVDRGAPRMAEYIALLRRYWTGESGRFDGDFWDVQVTGLGLEANVPVWVGALTPVMMRMAGRVADGVAGIPFWPARYAREVIRPAVDAGAREAGRTEPVPISGWVFTAIGEDRDQCRRDVAAYFMILTRIARAGALVAHMGWEEPWAEAKAKLEAGDRDGAIAALVPLVDELAITGTPAQAREQLATRWAGVYTTPVLFAPAGPRAESYVEAAIAAFGASG